MNVRVVAALVVITLSWINCATADPAAEAPSNRVIETNKRCEEALENIHALISDQAAADRVKTALDREIGNLNNPAWAPGYCQAISDNLSAKLASSLEGVRFNDETLIETAVRYEAFRIKAFRNTGVSPKRYFGFLDERGKTAAYERTLKSIAARIAILLNAYSEKNGLNITVTPKEIIVTQLAEGGALLLTDQFETVDRVHPVNGVGLDDYRIGFQRFPGLVSEIDKTFGTKLEELSIAREGAMTFTETILGTAVMYLYEKEIAEKKRLAEQLPSLKTLPLDEQFVHASLVYNSGILFSGERVKQMMAFDTAAYLVDTSEKTAMRPVEPRPRLPVILPEAADALLIEGKPLPHQPTSWNAVYHVMQRYGAWVALTKFSSYFTVSGDVNPVSPQ
jgi:hypothetical protein